MDTVTVGNVPIPPERRRFDRFPLNKTVSLLCGGRMVSGVGHNLSGNGVLLSIQVDHTWVGRSMERGLIPGAPLRLFLPSAGNRGEMQSVNVLGKIVRVDRDAQPDKVFVALVFD
jgi:hypothetical protein